MYYKRWFCALILLALASVTPALAGNACLPGDAPDVIVGSLPAAARFGSIGDITAYSVATTSCNVGTCQLQWIAGNRFHPVIGQNLYRLKDGRFEMLGQSWLKHGFFALSEDLCETPQNQCQGTNGSALGINCSDPYNTGLNGDQDRLGPRFEVNADTGFFEYPATDLFEPGDAIYKRLQVHNNDLIPALNEGATYYVEGHYIHPDDAVDNGDNNASYRRVNVASAGTIHHLIVTGSTVRGRAAIFAWPSGQPGVRMSQVRVPNEGLVIAASAATDNGNGTWTYEYAVHNLNSHRSVGSFEVPMPPGANVTNVGFHDVDYHSGEPYDLTDWAAALNMGSGPTSVSWATDTWEANENANALRWGTLYNFRFTVDVVPTFGNVTLGLYRPGTPGAVLANLHMPDCDGVDGNGVEAAPSEVLDVVLDQPTQAGPTDLSWQPPVAPGADSITYDVIRSNDPSDFTNPDPPVNAVCVSTGSGNTDFTEVDDPALNQAFYYLIRGKNDCPFGEGSLGGLRTARSCP